ncbi:hypothetical protein [Streptomyces rubellomurinus]|uniref:hypothetical protein n=1 Tax=Streptomyces rubellomurinus (strain ATCC 31215) TaxID=359131 RepID=UPI000AF80377|nr:hypothetical protein [Streptomyces rubellomurinus]
MSTGTVFRCRQCARPLSNSVEQQAWQPLPRIKGRAHYTYGPSHVPQGRFAADPEPYNPRVSSELDWVIHPADAVGMGPHPNTARLYGCCRRDGADGPNLVCAGCGAEVGIEVSDCWTAYDTRLRKSAVVAHERPLP